MGPDADLAGIKTNAVNGSYTPVEALRLMLANKGLEVVESPNGAVVIRRAGQPGQVAATPAGGGADIVVTGSRILRTGFDTLQSATVTDRAQLERRAYTNALDALQEPPGFAPAANHQVRSATANLGLAPSQSH